MLDQLVESTSQRRENQRRGGFMLSTFFVVFSLLSSGVLWSLFAKDLGMNTGNLEISQLVAPLAVADEQPPPPPEPIIKRTPAAAPSADVRTTIIQDIRESPRTAPDKVSVVKSNVPPRDPNHRTILGSDNISSANAANADYKGDVNPKSTGGGINGDPNGAVDGTANPSNTAAPVKVPPPPPLVKEEIKPKKTTKISLGVINGKAIKLITPPYPLAAKAIHAAGTVNVQVLIDEKGNVISANAVDGHPLLRQAAENAARASKFDPTTLSHEPVKVSGVIVYRFSAQ